MEARLRLRSRASRPARAAGTLCLAALLLGAGPKPQAATEPADDAVPFLGWRPATPWWARADRPTLHGASTLDPGLLGVAVGLGFPFILADVVYGAAERVDVRAGLRSAYGTTSSLEVGARVRLVGGPLGWALAGRLDAGATLHSPGELAGPVAGLRDLAVRPGLVVSRRGFSGAALFAEVLLEAGVDLDPAPLPLGGPPPAYRLLVDVPLHLGVEAPLGEDVSFFGILGVHLRLLEREDSGALPYLAFGLVFAG